MSEKNLKIRIANVSDAPELLKIYGYYVETTAITFEYDAPSLEEFENRIRNILKRYPYLVAELDGKIAGYAYVSAFKSRAAYDWAVETTVYVEKNSKGLGIGRRLYEALESILKKQNILNMDACIAWPVDGKEDEHLTTASVKFHEKMGYRMVGEFAKCGYKFGRWYSMVWMEKHIGEHKIPHPDMIPFEKIREEIQEEFG